MKSREQLDTIATRVNDQLPRGHRVAVIGSSLFWQAESEAICVAIGRRLAAVAGISLLTGGVGGVGETTARSFWESQAASEQPRLFHLLPHGYTVPDTGTTVHAGDDMEERREILGRVADTYIVVEGGPGTAHEASVARARSACIVPVGRTGGHARDLHARADHANLVGADVWESLGRGHVPPEDVANAAMILVEACGAGKCGRRGVA